MARGKERQIICAGCKRYCRRDKAVYIEKVVFSNPIERKDTVDQNEYRAVFKREVAYCPGCGKHLRVYEKKKQQNERNRERETERVARTPMFSERHSRSGGYKEDETQTSTQNNTNRPEQYRQGKQTQDTPTETQTQ